MSSLPLGSIALLLTLLACRSPEKQTATHESEAQGPQPGQATQPGTQPSAQPLSPLAKNSTDEGATQGEAEQGTDEEPKWDVNAPELPTRKVTLDVREGTYMNLDVSPNGREIVFDLLGDLYLVPLQGGEAQSLTSGMAWDMQPRFSPDGEWIAFSSDRAGGDNIWIVRRDGSDTRAVTEESFRLPTAPVWTPDGEYIAARKHFTSGRSLGAGEIWLYHRSGGGGLAMTEKPNEQKDVGEPAFSPNGRYLYYSRDITPGPTFEYSKDPHAEIYAIERLERETGRIERFVSGAGGSIRPTPSPDGKQLAFVRRIRGRSVLMIKDLESGAERALWSELDRDMQETWAIHGVYPAMAWLPDSRAIVTWAMGGLWLVDASSGVARRIPFHVQDTRTVGESLRFPIEIAPETFPVKLVRWAEVSPDGDAVVFQALGRLWIRTLENGEAQPLTGDEGHFEYFPSWSRDGRWIVYVAWDDDELGSVRVVPRSGGPGRVVSPGPGHYAEPVLSPDGRTIVYRRSGGGPILSPLWKHKTGLFRVPFEAGTGAAAEETRVAWSGRSPHFARNSERVFYFEYDGPEKRLLKSVGLEDREPRTHLSSEAATEMRVSPDGHWVAFLERFHAFVTPFPSTGREASIGPQAEQLPQARVSTGPAGHLRWAGDSRRLHWTEGPELFTRELFETFAFLEGSPEELPEAPESGIRIGFDAQAAAPEGSYLFENGRVISMRGDEILERASIAVEGNRITAVGSSDQVATPPGAQVIDLEGRTVLPGLIDVHAHGPQGANGIQPQQNWLHLATLSFGVTTIHDPSNDTEAIFASSELAKAGRILAPRITSTGTILYGAAGDFKAEIESLEDARFHVSRLQSVGAFSVKSYNQPRRDQRQMVLAAARELSMEVMPEGGSLFQHNMTQVVDGHTGIEHSIPVARIYDDVIRLWGATEVGYTPTLSVAYGGIWGENYWYQHTRVFENERLNRFVPRNVLDRRSIRNGLFAPEGEWNHIHAARVAKTLYDAGVEVNVGGHGQREGLAAHWEMWMMVQGGMTPHEALRCGTLHGARYIGAQADLGSIETGKLADLIVLASDPLEDIRRSEDIDLVMINGRLFDARTMEAVGPGKPARRALWFEGEAR